jgi:hypothetical protein
MSKVKRSVLKEIVKECLLEILFEGIDPQGPGFDDEDEMMAESSSRRVSPSSNRSLGEAVQKNLQQKKVPQNPKRKPIQSPRYDTAVSELTTDPLMAEIYRDTAMTTLQEQVEGRRPPIDNAAGMVENVNDISDIFDGADKWAAIAFNESE